MIKLTIITASALALMFGLSACEETDNKDAHSEMKQVAPESASKTEGKAAHSGTKQVAPEPEMKTDSKMDSDSSKKMVQ